MMEISSGSDYSDIANEIMQRYETKKKKEEEKKNIEVKNYDDTLYRKKIVNSNECNNKNVINNFNDDSSYDSLVDDFYNKTINQNENKNDEEIINVNNFYLSDNEKKEENTNIINDKMKSNNYIKKKKEQIIKKKVIQRNNEIFKRNYNRPLMPLLIKKKKKNFISHKNRKDIHQKNNKINMKQIYHLNEWDSNQNDLAKYKLSKEELEQKKNNLKSKNIDKVKIEYQQKLQKMRENQKVGNKNITMSLKCKQEKDEGNHNKELSNSLCSNKSHNKNVTILSEEKNKNKINNNNNNNNNNKNKNNILRKDKKLKQDETYQTLKRVENTNTCEMKENFMKDAINNNKCCDNTYCYSDHTNNSNNHYHLNEYIEQNNINKSNTRSTNNKVKNYYNNRKTTNPKNEKTPHYYRNKINTFKNFNKSCDDNISNHTYKDTLDVHGNNLDVHGNNLDIHGNNLDVHGNNLDVHGNNLDVHGNNLDIHGNNLDIHGNNLHVYDSNNSSSYVTKKKLFHTYKNVSSYKKKKNTYIKELYKRSGDYDNFSIHTDDTSYSDDHILDNFTNTLKNYNENLYIDIENINVKMDTELFEKNIKKFQAKKYYPNIDFKMLDEFLSSSNNNSVQSSVISDDEYVLDSDYSEQIKKISMHVNYDDCNEDDNIIRFKKSKLETFNYIKNIMHQLKHMNIEDKSNSEKRNDDNINNNNGDNLKHINIDYFIKQNVKNNFNDNIMMQKDNNFDKDAIFNNQTNEVINLIEKDDSYYNSKLEKIKYNDEHLINDQMKITTKPYPLMEYLFKENDDKYNEMDNHINDIDDDDNNNNNNKKKKKKKIYFSDDDNINNLCDENIFRKYHIKSNMNNNQNILNVSNSYNQNKVSNISKRYSIEKNTNTMKNQLDNMSYISSFNNIKNEDILNVHNDQLLSFDTIKLNNSRKNYHENNLINIKNCDSISRDILNNEENEIISDKYSDKLMTYKNYDSQNEHLKEEKYNKNQKTKTKLNTINKTKELNLYTLKTHHDDQQINNLRKDTPTDANTNANISMNIENVSKTNKETYIKKNIHMIHKSNNNIPNVTPIITNPTNSKMNNIVKKKKSTQQITTLQTKKTNKNTVLKIKGGEEKQKKIIQTKNITSKVLNKNIEKKGETVLVPSKKKEKLMNNSEKTNKEENCSNKENRLINQKIMNTSINFDDTQNLSDEDKFIFDSYLNEENTKKESLQEIISNQVRQFEQIFL
ncbi:hypothetical protein PRSY57_0924800 [Plasmodium reichenowi]|uniref:Coiled-coil domain-containing protein 52 n=1 Tax=Plasmodium reichenowi TaxID=5854 RepID=A0A151LHV8_PLARE|nr:hypothetical protein PRSY57_0924800 [Plasmodium reichenowi]KYN98558.1 hypothetical protein PRSY57_0924800 [Plasmodium reichenowi]